MSSSSLRRFRLPLHSPRTASSTAQANLARILTIIVTVPPPPPPPDSVIGTSTCPDAIDTPNMILPLVPLNLDLRLGLSLDMPLGSELLTAPVEEDEGIPTAHSGIVNCPNRTFSYEAPTVNKISKKAPSAADSILAADTSSEGECSPEAAPIMVGSGKEISEITNTSCKAEEDINGEAEDRQGYLDLLLEAARQVSSVVVDDDDDKASLDAPPPPPPPPAPSASRKRKTTSPAAPRSKRLAAAAAAFNAYEETEPIVRSRRGRNQTLPSRYRDSILEPWRKAPTVLRR